MSRQITVQQLQPYYWILHLMICRLQVLLSLLHLPLLLLLLLQYYDDDDDDYFYYTPPLFCCPPCLYEVEKTIVRK